MAREQLDRRAESSPTAEGIAVYNERAEEALAGDRGALAGEVYA